jgi:hypothetical protein
MNRFFSGTKVNVLNGKISGGPTLARVRSRRVGAIGTRRNTSNAVTTATPTEPTVSVARASRREIGLGSCVLSGDESIYARRRKIMVHAPFRWAGRTGIRSKEWDISL